MKEKYLPIGTVVLLNGGTKRLMITGFCAIAKETKEMYDYVGCLYPEGTLTSDRSALFNHEQIKEIYALGYSDEEEKTFKENLKKVLEENANNVDEII